MWTASRRWGLLLLLAVAWLSWSGHYTYTLEHWPIALFFIASCLFVWRLVRALDREAGGDSEFPGPGVWLRLPRFLLVFVFRVAQANLHVVRLIFGPASALHPRLRRVPASQRTPFGQVLYANFITLTPGTITLDLRDGELLVYALDANSEADVVDGSMDRDVLRLEGRSS